MNISMAMLNQVDVYHLQRRNGDEAIGAAGLVGCFGGKIEPGESSRQALIRELAEETNLVLHPEGVRELDAFDVESDHHHTPVLVHVKVLEVLLPYGLEVIAREGELVSWTRQEIIENDSKLTPATKKFFQRYF